MTHGVWALALALTASLTAGQAGGSGGDPYFPLDGNQGYDVARYRIHLEHRPATDRLRGRAVLEVTATEALQRFSLDLVLTVDAVRVDGEPAAYAKPHPHELEVQPAEPLEAGQRFTVVVRYHGRPSAVTGAGARPGTDLWFHRPGETVAMGQPQNGAWWFPANETPADKASYDLSVTVPRGQEVVAAGRLVGRRTVAGQTTWRWRQGTPVATYLAFFVAGDLRLERGTAGDRPYLAAVSRRLPEAAQDRALRRLRATEPMVAWLESWLGPYPFRTVGGVVPGVAAGYALETATRPVYPGLAGSSYDWRGLMVHELAHQWAGNDVTVLRWRDVWLNEGLATYAEWRYAAEHGGPSVAQTLGAEYDARPADADFWRVQVSDPGPADMFSAPVYRRGAMTLAALAARVGTPAVDELLRTWVARHGGRGSGHGTGEEFRALAEAVSGEDLEGFFTHWLDEAVKPAATAENGLAPG